MDMKEKKQRRLSERFVLAGVLFSALFWFLEAFIHSFYFDKTSLMSQLFPTDPNESWMRLMAVSIIMSFSLYSSRIVFRRKQAEEALEASEKKYRGIVETAEEGIWRIDERGETSFVNKKMAGMLGYPADGMAGRPFLSFLDAQGCEIAGRKFKDWRRGLKEQQDFRFIRKDGSELWSIVSASPEFDGFGRYAGALLMVSDISERKRAEDALMESRELYSALAETAQDFIFVIDRELRVRYMNSYSLAHLGLERDQAAGKGLDDLFPPAVAEKFRGDLLRVFATGENLRAEEMAPIGGKALWLDTSLTPLKGGNGEIKAVIVNSVLGIARDITGRKMTEFELREAKDKAEMYFENAAVIFLILGRDNKIMRLNRKGCETLGVTKNSAIGADWFDSFLPENVREDRRRIFEKIVSGEAVVDSCEVTVVASGGSERLIAWHNTALRDDNGGINAILFSGEDITEAREAEEALRQRVDELERFGKATVEREFRIKDLKDRVAELEQKLSMRDEAPPREATPVTGR